MTAKTLQQSSDDRLSTPGHGAPFTRIKFAPLDLMLSLLRLDFGLMALLQLRRRHSLLTLCPIVTFLEQTTLGRLKFALHQARSAFQLRDSASKLRINSCAGPANNSPIMLARS
jgi:hypothetical protein